VSLPTSAAAISATLKEILNAHKILVDRIFWMAFDGTANMAGCVNSVQAVLKSDCLHNANYIHCRRHLLNLAAANVAKDFKPLRSLFSCFNSLWKFFHNSPKRHNNLVEVQNILNGIRQ